MYQFDSLISGFAINSYPVLIGLSFDGSFFLFSKNRGKLHITIEKQDNYRIRLRCSVIVMIAEGHKIESYGSIALYGQI